MTFFREVLRIIGATTCFTISIGFILVLPLAMLAVGAQNYDECPAEQSIPLWLIMSGLVNLAVFVHLTFDCAIF